MRKMSYVNVKLPDELKKKVVDILVKVADSGKIRKGMNETTKAIERGIAKLVVISEDVDPPEVVMHLPLLCAEKKVPCAFVDTKSDLGNACGLKVSCSSVAVVEAGDAEGDIKKLADQIAALG
ncbi:MAG: 50S ribosomal protein L7Ae [Promethearchaeota archaeon]